MKKGSEWSPGPGVKASTTDRTDGGWIVSAVMASDAQCPACGTRSSRRHGWCIRHLQDLPAQGAAVKLMLRVARWRCVSPGCAQVTFGDRLPQVVAPYSHRTRRVVDLAHVLAYTAVGRPAARLMARLGAPQSKDTLLRSLKRGVKKQAAAAVRVAGVDDWSWRKGSTYGTIMVAGAAQGAPQAAQIADRFHLLQNFRHAIEQQLTRAPGRQLQLAPQEIVVLQEPPGLIHRYGQPEVTEHRHLVRAGRRGRSQLGFDRVGALHDEGATLARIARETGFNWRMVRKRTRLDAFRPQATMAPKATTPAGFGAYLARRWNEGCTMGRQLLAEIRPLGYTGSLTHLQRLLNGWRRAHFAAVITASAPECPMLTDGALRLPVPPIVASALCIKPRGLLTSAQCEKVDYLKAAYAEFAGMRALAMRFRGLLRGGNIELLDTWLSDAASSSVHAMRQFAATLRRDLAAVRNAILEPWSNGQTEGQNRLKTLKRAMYGRAGTELRRARLLPLRAS
jgi:transposase